MTQIKGIHSANIHPREEKSFAQGLGVGRQLARLKRREEKKLLKAQELIEAKDKLKKRIVTFLRESK